MGPGADLVPLCLGRTACVPGQSTCSVKPVPLPINQRTQAQEERDGRRGAAGSWIEKASSGHKEKVAVSLHLTVPALCPVVTGSGPPQTCPWPSTGSDRIRARQVLQIGTTRNAGWGGEAWPPGLAPSSAQPPGSEPLSTATLGAQAPSSVPQAQWDSRSLFRRASTATPSATCPPTWACPWWWQSSCCPAWWTGPPSSLKTPSSR